MKLMICPMYKQMLLKINKINKLITLSINNNNKNNMIHK